MTVTMTARWDNVGTVIPAAAAEYMVAEQPIAEYDNWFNYNIVADIQAVIDDVINKYNANTILKADSDNTPAALAVGTNTIVGRAAGTISALAGADVRTILNVEDGADVTDAANVNSSGAVMETDFNATTFLYATSDNVPQPKTVAETLAILGVSSGAEANLFEEVANVLREKSSGGYDNDFVIGSPQLDDDGNTAHDYRMWFDKSNGAFRVGHVSGTTWDSANVGYCSFASGHNTTASAAHAYVRGSSGVASADYSCATGSQSNAYLYGQHAHSSGVFAANGDSQISNIIVMRETTNATQTELSIFGSLPTVLNRATIPASRTWAFTINIAARQTAGIGTVGDSGIYKIEGGIKRDGASNTALVGAITKTVLAEDQSTWDVTAEADNVNDCLVVKVTGEASKTIHWVARVSLVEVG